MNMNQKALKLAGSLIMPLVLTIAAACGGDSTTVSPATSSAPPAATVPDTTSMPDSTRTRHSPATTTAPSAAPRAAGAEQFEKLNVVATSNIVADWVRSVGKDRVDVFSLLPPNADPHTHQPGAQDIARVADADLVFSVGLSLEGNWLEELVENAAQDEGSVVALADAVNPIDFVETFDEHSVGYSSKQAFFGRLLIGDGETGMVSVIDLQSGEVEQDAFDLGARAERIYSTTRGRFAFAVSSGSNNTYVFDGGVRLEGHGAHFDLVKEPVEQLDIDLSGERPEHLSVGREWATVFYDGSGNVALLNEHELGEAGSDYVPPRVNVGPQHGAAVPLGDDRFVVTIQHPNYEADPEIHEAPIGAKIVDLAGQVLHHGEGCEDLHGEARNGRAAVFVCTGGALVVTGRDGKYEAQLIPAPDDEPEDSHFISVWGHPGLDHFFGFGPEVGLYIIDPDAGAMDQLISALEEPNPIGVTISHDGEALLVVLSDGELRMYDALDLDLLASASGFLTPPVETGFWARPHVATAPGAIFVTDSVGGQVLHLDGHDLSVVEGWEVAGNPTKIAFVGILGEAEGHEEQGHEEEEEDRHGHGDLDPHFWFDPLRVKQAVNSIAARLSTVDPGSQTIYLNNAAEYNQRLDELHAWIQEQVYALPEGDRVLVTSHDSFQYFALRYDFEVAGAIFPVSTQAEPTARDLAELIETIEHEGVSAVFTERSHSERLAKRVAEETGATLIGGLYTGSLSEEGGDAVSYIELMRHNTNTIVEALR